MSGANFIIAETGSSLIVTNEGNGRLVTTLPRVHVAITGIEKVVPTLEDVTTLLRLLPRHGTGQSITNYISVTTGPRREGDTDGPEHFHVILVDAGRTKLIGGDMQEMLRCIRCGACMNHCPVYQSVGGHAYGWVYPGPMGSVLTPLTTGLARALELPNACTGCGRCEETCPMRIPLPEHLRQLRDDAARAGLTPRRWRVGMGVAMAALRWPWLYRLGAELARASLRFLGRHPALVQRIPALREWVAGRALPAPQAETFLARWQRREAGRNGAHRL